MTIWRRNLFRAALATPFIVAGRGALAATAPKRIVVLLARGWTDATSGFRDYLAQRGIAADMSVRDAAGDLSRIAGFVREINAAPPDLVYISGSAAALEALGPYDAVDPARHITVPPVIVNLVADPVACLIVQSLAVPGREVTGIIEVAPMQAQLRSLVAYREFRTVAVIYNHGDPDAQVAVAKLRGRLGADGLKLLEYPVTADTPSAVDAIPAMVAEARQNGAEWLYLPPDQWLEAHRKRITRAALDVGLPSFATTEPFLTDASGLVGLVCQRQNTGARAGRRAEQILLEGKRASSLPFARPDSFSVVIRMESARALQIYPPMTLLRYAEAK